MLSRERFHNVQLKKKLIGKIQQFNNLRIFITHVFSSEPILRYKLYLTLKYKLLMKKHKLRVDEANDDTKEYLISI